MKIGSGATVKLFHLYLEDGPAPPIDLLQLGPADTEAPSGRADRPAVVQEGPDGPQLLGVQRQGVPIPSFLRRSGMHP